MKKVIDKASDDSIWVNPAIRSYLGEISRRYGVVETLALPNMRDLPPIRIEKLFVQPLLSERYVNPLTSPNEWPEGETILSTLEKYRSVVLLGDPGSGKTTLTNWLAWRVSVGLTKALPKGLDDVLPIPCVLREMSSSIFFEEVNILNLAKNVAERLIGSELNKAMLEFFDSYIRLGKYLLILDGIDEIPVTHRKAVSKWMESVHLDEAYAVATSRLVGYDDFPIDKPLDLSKEVSEPLDDHSDIKDKIISSAFNVNRTKMQRSIFDSKFATEILGPRWAVLRFLMPFDEQRSAAFVENWYLQRSGSEQDAKEKSSDLLAALRGSNVMLELARTPNLLSLMG